MERLSTLMNSILYAETAAPCGYIPVIVFMALMNMQIATPISEM